MKSANLFIVIFFFISLNAIGQIVRLEKNESGNVVLLRNNKPLLLLGGELGNSSATAIRYFDTLFPQLKDLNLNTILVPVYWELLEPAEGVFDYTLIDKMIIKARENELNLVLLWFGSWKNSMSCYVPAWVKKDFKRFPRSLNKKGEPSEILSPFYAENLEADIKAFKALMNRVKEVDSTGQVIMIQVENEIGMLPDAREYSKNANNAFDENVPEAFIEYLKKNKDKLLPYLKNMWTKNGSKTSGNWVTIFGEGLATDELFIAWNFAVYANKVARAGKEIYPLPMFVNCALNRPGLEPGKYPSGGPLPYLMNVWQAAAPNIDFLAPDIYHGDFKDWSNKYDLLNNPLFIPEIRLENKNAAQVFYVLGKYRALGFSPFSIEDLIGKKDASLSKSYKLLDDFSELYFNKSTDSKMFGCYFDVKKQTDTIYFNEYQINISHDYTLGWSSGAIDSIWPETACILIETGKDEFWIAGTGVVLEVSFLNKKNSRAGLLSVDQCTKINGKWRFRRLNGDQ
ncbi:MAG: DUF5597 domain-containing protein, partial [Bacteroidales bacterium]|nr:DUF5597 domain-containing protein [Bacteroidales bacterium]